MRKIVFLLIVILAFSCKKKQEKVALKFLDEFILPDSLFVDGTLVGGLSGIDYNNDAYYLVCDDAKKPRLYEAKILIDSNKISDIIFDKVAKINDTTQYNDLESILFEEGKILLISEGLIRKNKDPSFFKVNHQGEIENHFEIPNYFQANSPQKPRNNGVFEGLARSFDKKGYWVATELPLETDGIEPTDSIVNSPVRITYFNKKTKRAEKQFAYQLDKVAKTPKGGFSVNGVTDLLMYAPNKFLVIERSYSSGHGNLSNDIKIYGVNTKKVTDVLNILNLKNEEYISANKKLLFDFESVRDQLTNSIIDNIEGICFGP